MSRNLRRRTLLRVAGGCAGTVALACAGCERGAVDEPTGKIMAGTVSTLAVGALRVIDGPVVLARDEQGVYAMSAVCTHAGCALDASDGKIAGGLGCGCHGSAFDGAGNVTRGPANRALSHHAVEIDAAGAITVRADLPAVSADVRTSVPA